MTPWSEIIDRCLRGREPAQFLKLDSVGDFIDGFQIMAPTGVTGRQLELLLMESGLDVHPPMVRGPRGTFWVQFKSGPYDLQHNQPIFKRVQK